MFLLIGGSVTQVPRGQRWSRGGGLLVGAGVKDGAIGFIVNQAGHEEAVLVLAGACGSRTRLQLGVTAGGVAADGAVVPPVRARLEGGHSSGSITLKTNDAFSDVPPGTQFPPLLLVVFHANSNETKGTNLLIQILVALVQVLVLQAPLVLDVDVSVEFPRQSLAELWTQTRISPQLTDRPSQI